MTQYRKWYNQAKSRLAQIHNKELHQIMAELGYSKKEKVMKVADKKEVKKVSVK
jgi:hypothetical protein